MKATALPLTSKDRVARARHAGDAMAGHGPEVGPKVCGLSGSPAGACGRGLLLDCRFFAVNTGRIAGCVHLCFGTIVWRQAKSVLGLEHVVPEAELCCCLLANAHYAVVRLDQSSVALDNAKRHCTVVLAHRALCREAQATQIFLKGGQEAFSASCSKQSTSMGLS